MSPYTCPVCQKLLKSSSSQVIHMHEKSNFHQAALTKQGAVTIENKQNDKIETKPEVIPISKVAKMVISEQTKTQKLDIKPVEPKKNVENQKTEDEEWGGFFGD